jgi:outer membrane protein OmpA-like peptidoglycan-associated protein
MKTLTKTTLGLALLGALGTLAGCGASTPPRELADARTAYVNASRSPNAGYAANELLDAQRSLAKAEKSFQDDNDETTRELAYLAHRRAIAAGAKADTVKWTQEKQQALADLEQAKQRHAVATAAQLDRTKAQLNQSQAQTDSERQARIAADQKAQDALAKIKDLQTKPSDKGLVLTLPGSVLFATGKSMLLGGAQQRLKDVAAALKEDTRPILIVGHTDNTGSDEVNQRLSQERAASVQKFLVQQGLPADRVKTQGMGKDQPIASNETPDGRAQNRRVEIILENGGGTTGTGPTPTNNAKPGMPQGLNGPQVPAPNPDTKQ